MVLAEMNTPARARAITRPAHIEEAVARPDAPGEIVAPLYLHPDELRQLRQAYRDLLELHRAEVVEDENLEDAHRLMVEQVWPLRAILRAQDRLVVDPRVEQTY